jgi:mRNA interferase RelE/StbE
MKYKIIVHKRAARYLKSLPESQKQRIKRSLKELEHGITHKVDVKSMVGEWKGY